MKGLYSWIPMCDSNQLLRDGQLVLIHFADQIKVGKYLSEYDCFDTNPGVIQTENVIEWMGFLLPSDMQNKVLM